MDPKSWRDDNWRPLSFDGEGVIDYAADTHCVRAR